MPCNNMTKLLNTLSILSFLLCACSSPVDQVEDELKDSIVSQTVATDSVSQTVETDSVPEPDLPLPPEKTWEEEQAVFREQLVAGLTNEVLKNSFLQEMYIRKVAKVSGDTVYIDIGFNLHGYDCGAPDCYTTDVSFNFPLGDSLIFPESLPFTEHEYGCLDDGYQISGVYKLVDSDYRYVKYVSAKNKRTLFLFSDKEDNWSIAHYYVGIDPARLHYHTLDTLNRYLEEEETDLQPYMSWTLSTNQYDRFIDKDR